MGCLFSKKSASSEEDLIRRDGDTSDASGAGPAASAHPSATGSTAVDNAPAVSFTPDVLKPMGRGGFADITTGIQEQLGRYGRVHARRLQFFVCLSSPLPRVRSWKAPLNPSETGEEGKRYVTNENFHELQLGATLGKGNYGVVHSGTWRATKVAVKKVLLPEGMSQAQQRRLVEDFKCEVDICCRLTHPRLVAFLGYTTAPDLCIVQELMEQGSLYDQFRRGWRAKSLEQQLVLAHDIARGMAYLHAWRPPLIHRDLKSLNILVSADQPTVPSSGAPLARCKVTDFGMTRAKAMGQPTEAEAMAGGASPAEVMTLAMTRCGTPFWTAPEIIQGGTYNETVDQYAFGCVCLEILTGSPPWQTTPPAGRRSGGSGTEQMAPIKVMQVITSPSLSVLRFLTCSHIPERPATGGDETP